MRRLPRATGVAAAVLPMAMALVLVMVLGAVPAYAGKGGSGITENLSVVSGNIIFRPLPRCSLTATRCSLRTPRYGCGFARSSFVMLMGYYAHVNRAVYAYSIQVNATSLTNISVLYIFLVCCLFCFSTGLYL